MDTAGVAAAALLGYLLGSFPSADLAARFAGRGVDLRVSGSGNPGATNAARVLGKQWGAAVTLIVDLGKGVAAAFAGSSAATPARTWPRPVVAGHIAPPWSRFRGGKGMATSAGACLTVLPLYFPIYIAARRGVVGTRRTEIVAAGSARGVAAAVVWSAASWPNGWGPRPGVGLITFTVIASAMILAKFALTRTESQPT